MRKLLITIGLILFSVLTMSAQTYVGTMTLGRYTQREVRVQLQPSPQGGAVLTLYGVRFSRMMPVKVDVELRPVVVSGQRIQADGIVPTAKGKRYEKYIVRQLDGTATDRLLFRCRMGEKELQFDGRRVAPLPNASCR